MSSASSKADPSFRTTVALTRSTAKEARRQLRDLGYGEEQLPARGKVAEILNRLGYRLRRVLKAKPKKNILETDAIFANVKGSNLAALEYVRPAGNRGAKPQ